MGIIHDRFDGTSRQVCRCVCVGRMGVSLQPRKKRTIIKDLSPRQRELGITERRVHLSSRLLQECDSVSFKPRPFVAQPTNQPQPSSQTIFPIIRHLFECLTVSCLKLLFVLFCFLSLHLFCSLLFFVLFYYLVFFLLCRSFY